MQQADPDSEAEAVVQPLRDRLHADEYTATPADVLNTIDAALLRLYFLRDEAYREHVRRTNSLLADAAIGEQWPTVANVAGEAYGHCQEHNGTTEGEARYNASEAGEVR